MGTVAKTSDTTGLAYKQLKLNRMLKTIKRLLLPLFFHFWSLTIFLMLLWFPMNAAGAPLLYYDLLVKQPAFNQLIGHVHPTTCGWNFGRLHGSTFVEGENPSLHAVPTKTWMQMDYKLHSGVLGGTNSTLWLPLEGKLGVIRADIPSKAEGKEKKKEYRMHRLVYGWLMNSWKISWLFT